MKKIISVFAIGLFTLGVAQETPKKSCCAGANKTCSTKKDGKMAKSCDMKDHKDCKMDHKKSTAKKVVKAA